MMKLTILVFLPVCLAVCLAGCSGGSSPVGSTEGTIGSFDTGVLLDSAVQGIAYTTPSGSGITNQQGEFRYRQGEAVTFAIGDLELPPTTAAAVLTPLSIFNTDDLGDPRVINLSRLLQSLDRDGIADNGIDIPDSASASAPASVDFAGGDFDTDVANLVANSGSTTTTLVQESVAIAHLTETLESNGLLSGDCGKTHPAVGRTAEFSSFEHGVGGLLTIVDDCTIEISRFNYDGGGPTVYFYAANNRRYGSEEAFIIGPLLSGQTWENDSLRLRLPAGKSLNDFDSVSVWCSDFDINFGDASIAEPL